MTTKHFQMMTMTFCTLISFAACNGNNNGNSQNNASGTIDQTPQFLSAASNVRYKSIGTSLRFGNDASFEMILDRPVFISSLSSPGAQPQAQCNMRFSGTSAYYQQKSTTLSGATALTGPVIDLTLSQSQIISDQLTFSPKGSTLTADSICNEYMQNLMSKKVLELGVVEFTSDHITVWSSTDFGYPQMNLNKTIDKQIESYTNDDLGMGSQYTYLVKDGGSLDITSSFVKSFADSTYVTDTSSSTNAKNEANLILDAGLRELTVSDSRCGFKYIIDISSIATDGGTPLLRGKIADSFVATPATKEDDGNSSTGSFYNKCTDLQSMIEGVSNQGMEISGLTNVCTDDNCTAFYNDLRIGKPGSRSTTDPILSTDSLMLTFQSSTVNAVRPTN